MCFAIQKHIVCEHMQAIEAGVVRMSNFKGVALGDSWISPIGEFELCLTC